MAREYAGHLGALGMTVMLVRGAIHSAGVEGTFLQAVVALAALATVGLVAGAIAEGVVDQSVRQQLEQRLAEAGAADAA